MSNNKLSQEEIEKRLTRLRNLEKLHLKAKADKQKLNDEVVRLKNIEEENKKTIETLLLRIEELEKMVFSGKDGGSSNVLPYCPGKKRSKKKKRRKKSSYKRVVPPEFRISVP